MSKSKCLDRQSLHVLAGLASPTDNTGKHAMMPISFDEMMAESLRKDPAWRVDLLN